MHYRRNNKYKGRWSVSRLQNYINCGQLECLRFNKDPRFLNGKEFTVEVGSLQPQRLLVPDVISPISPKSKNPVIACLRSELGIKTVEKSLESGEIEGFIQTLPGPVPSDYSAPLKETNGFVANGWEFLGTKAADWHNPDADITILFRNSAETKAVIVREDEPWALYMYDMTDYELTLLKGSFSHVLLGLLSGEPGGGEWARNGTAPLPDAKQARRHLSG